MTQTGTSALHAKLVLGLTIPAPQAALGIEGMLCDESFCGGQVQTVTDVGIERPQKQNDQGLDPKLAGRNASSVASRL